jgi:hypothetical protein
MLCLSLKRQRVSGKALFVSAILGILLALSACGSGPPPPPNTNPMDDQSCAIGLQLKMRIPAKIMSIKPNLVVFARVEEGVPLTESFELYGSTYTHDGYAYLMNAEPGTYVVVAAINEHESTSPFVSGSDSEVKATTEVYRNYFSCDLIEQTRTTVTPGSFAFIGRIVGDQSRTFGDGDDCQQHFLALVEDETKSGLTKLVYGAHSRRVDPHEKDASDPAKKEFLIKSKEFFATTGWNATIDAELSRTP